MGDNRAAGRNEMGQDGAGETARSGLPAPDESAALGLTSEPLVRRHVPARWAPRATQWLDEVSGLAAVQRIYDRTVEVMAETGKSFCDAALDAMDLSVRVNRADVDRIPKKGALVVTANHPFGGVEGVVLASLMGRVRGDVKLLANELLEVFTELTPQLISLDVFGGESAAKKNAAGMREAMRHLKDGGCLIVFPAGEVSHFRGADLGVTDSEWQRGVGMLVRRSGASVLPVYVPGGNGVVFNALGMVHPKLRTMQLPKSTARRCGTSMEIRVGGVIPAKKLAEHGDDAEVMRYLRQRVYLMRYRAAGEASDGQKAPVVPVQAVGAVEVICETEPAVIEKEIARLPAEALLVPGEEYCAYLARPRQIPHVLREIGRLREITFRAVGEGTGKALDLDEFDNHYLHLFVYHKKDRRIVGAYRLGRVDLIVRAKGKKGLYTSTLFNYPEKLLQQLGGAVEMGRSFVRAEYQRSHQPLLMLWRGIGTFVVRNPRYYALFGPVSISAAYASVSRQLMVKYLLTDELRADGAEMVKARAPFRMRRYQGLDDKTLARLIRDTDDISDFVGDIEPDAKGIPVLLSQYLKLGARILNLNVDKDFGGCVDALVTVDLRKTEPKLLKRYMGEEGLATFHKQHRVGQKVVAR
jgi:putative hemolysin